MYGRKLSPKNIPASKKRMTVDIVTGKELVNIYFDPEKAIGLEPRDSGKTLMKICNL